MTTPPASLLQCQTREQLAALLDVNVSTLNYYAYGHHRKYKTFEIPKKSGGKRKITAPYGALRTIQRKLATHLVELYPSPSYVNGFVDGKSVLTNATPHLNKNYILNIDLKDFFPSITSARVIGLLRSGPFNLNNQVASIIAGLTTYSGVLPQGAPTSPVLANMICFKLDRSLRRFSNRHSVIYTRYADDLTFSSNRALPRAFIFRDEDTTILTPGDRLKEIISSNYFDINPKKTRLSCNGQAKYVTGVKVNAVPNLSRRYIRQVKNMLNAWEKHTLAGAQKEFEEKYNGGKRRFENVLWGKLSYLKSIKTSSDTTYAKLHNKFAELECKGRPLIPVTQIEALQSRVFVVTSEKEVDGRPAMQQGTAFLLDEKWLLTCNHVAQLDGSNAKYFQFDAWIPQDQHRTAPIEETRSATDDFDIVALSFTPSDEMLRKSFKLAPEGVEVEVGNEFRVVGFPSYRPSDKPHVRTVKVDAINPSGTYSHAFVSQKLIGGFSGSPVLDDNDYVVGIAQRGEEFGSVGNTFLPIQELRKYLATLD